jgi:hypothetical protein
MNLLSVKTRLPLIELKSSAKEDKEPVPTSLSADSPLRPLTSLDYFTEL